MAFIDTLNLAAEKRALLSQFLRYGITGAAVTLVGVAVYWICAVLLGFAPLVATFLAYLVAVSIGYVAHSRFSFKGHGSRENQLATTSRFIAGSLLSYALNSLFVWITTGLLDGPAWWGIPPMVFVTPVIIFIVNRIWVFR